MGTPFATVYNRFLGKITDDLYVELTPQDTIRDLQNLLTSSLSGFEFPRKSLGYVIDVTKMVSSRVRATDFVVGNVEGDSYVDNQMLVDRSAFTADLTDEEVNIIALLMLEGWVQRQVTSIENTRMKYSGSDFKFTSQANHLSKLVTLLNNCKAESKHLQRLYKRRRPTENGGYESNWDILGKSRFDL